MILRPKPRLFAALSIFAWCLSCTNVAKSQEKAKQVPVPNQEKKISSYAELVKAYEIQKIKFEKNVKAESLMFRTSKGDFQGVMVVKWDGVNGVLHLIQTWPMNVPKDKREQFLKAAQTLNHGFLFPGIGINLSNGGTYYRLSIPVSPRGYLHDYEVGTYTRFTINQATEFYPTMQKVMEGKISTDELILYHQKYLRSLAEKQTPDIKLDGRYSRTIEGIEWTLDFSDKGKVRVLRDGKMGVESRVTIKGAECTMTDLDGPLAAKETGSYRIVASDGKLTFRLVKDDAEQRKTVLTSGTWTEKK